MLWINQNQRGDYMRDQLMVGMRHLVGANMVDWVKVLPPQAIAQICPARPCVDCYARICV